MGQVVIKETKSAQDSKVLARLDVFDPREIERSLEFHDVDVNDWVKTTIRVAMQMLRVTKIQLEQENFTHLEYSVHKLRSMFLSLGCNRLSFLFEKIYKNLTKLRMQYLRELLSLAKTEFEMAHVAINHYLSSKST